MNRTKVFISYSHIDEEWRGNMCTHLRVLEKQGLLQCCDDTYIRAGEGWYDRIRAMLSEAQVAVLLVSANFLSSDYVQDEEVPALLRRHQQDGMVMIPVIVRPCAWKEVAWLARMQIRPRGARPISSGDKHQVDQDLSEIATEVIEIIRRSPVGGDGKRGNALGGC